MALLAWMLGFAGFHSLLSSYNLPNVKSQYDWIGFADIGSALGGGSGYGAYGGCTTVSLTPILTLTKTDPECNPEHESDPD